MASPVLLAFVVGVAFAALPPGLDEELYCPPDTCLANKIVPAGFVGPRTAFVHCAGPRRVPSEARPWGLDRGEDAKLALLTEGLVLAKPCEDVDDVESDNPYDDAEGDYSYTYDALYDAEGAEGDAGDDFVGCDCPSGSYFDGCNACHCNKDGVAMCTKKMCAPELVTEPKCLDAATTAAPVDTTAVPFDGCACPDRTYFDGCNHCYCDPSTSVPLCTRMYCLNPSEPMCTDKTTTPAPTTTTTTTSSSTATLGPDDQCASLPCGAPCESECQRKCAAGLNNCLCPAVVHHCQADGVTCGMEVPTCKDEPDAECKFLPCGAHCRSECERACSMKVACDCPAVNHVCQADGRCSSAYPTCPHEQCDKTGMCGKQCQVGASRVVQWCHEDGSCMGHQPACLFGGHDQSKPVPVAVAVAGASQSQSQPQPLNSVM